jgi:hypothetical protein
MRFENHYDYWFGRDYGEMDGISESTVQVFAGKAMYNLCWAVCTPANIKTIYILPPT